MGGGSLILKRGGWGTRSASEVGNAGCNVRLDL